MGLTIDLYCNDGSPLHITPPDIYGRGVGGAELAMMTWAETMAGRGHRVRIYNNPSRPGPYDGVEYLPQADFEPQADRDVFIVYRSPGPHAQTVKAGFKVHWSTDQYTVGNFATDIFPFVDRVVCISPYHVDYHRGRYGIEARRIGYFDLGIRLDYGANVEKIAGRCVFCSVPDRGLDILHICWPRIKERVPFASLVITSDYTLWGAPRPGNHRHRLDWLHEHDVTFLGKVDRRRLVREQQVAVCQSYPCTYEELFCISAAECQAAGTIPVTSDFGALRTTNEWGWVIPGNPMQRSWQDQFVEAVAEVLLTNIDPIGMGHYARRRFDWDRICSQWEDLFATGEFGVIPWEMEQAA